MITLEEFLPKYLKSHDIMEQCKVLPEPEVTIILTNEQTKVLKDYVSIPESMDDHWIVFTVEDRTYFIRSWTHRIAFVLHYSPSGSNVCITTIQRGTAFNVSLKKARFKQTTIDYINDILPRELKYERPRNT